MTLTLILLVASWLCLVVTLAFAYCDIRKRVDVSGLGNWPLAIRFWSFAGFVVFLVATFVSLAL